MTNQAMQKTERTMTALERQLRDERVLAEIRKAVPKHLSAERMLRAAITAYKSSPQLGLCDQTTIFGAIFEAAQMGLELGTGPMAQAHLVPIKDKNRGPVCELWIDYRGLVALVMRSGMVSSIDAEVVREGDAFAYQKGTKPDLTHIPADSDRGEVTHAYAVAYMHSGPARFCVLSREDVERHRKSSAAGKSTVGPWATHWDEMAKKTAVRQLCKLLPMSSDLPRLADEPDSRVVSRAIATVPAAAVELPQFSDVDENGVVSEPPAAAVAE